MASRIPEKDSDFNTYIHATDDALQVAGPPTGAERLGLTPAEATEWNNYRQDWDDIYTLYGSTDTRTKTVTDNKNQLKADFDDFARPLLNRIAASPNLINSDRNIFKLPAPDTTPTQRGPILEVPSGSFKSIGGAKLQVRARQTTDASRASMHPLADAVEIRYLVVDPAAPEGEANPNADTYPNSQLSTKALFVVSFPNDHLGKRVLAALRWVNINNPANNSGWSILFSTVVS